MSADRDRGGRGEARVLVVGADDVALNLRAAYSELTFETAGNLDDGTRAFEERRPAVLVCCLDGEGWQLTPLIWDARHASVPVLAVASTEEAGRAVKPAPWVVDRNHPEVIVKTLSELLDNGSYAPPEEAHPPPGPDGTGDADSAAAPTNAADTPEVTPAAAAAGPAAESGDEEEVEWPPRRWNNGKNAAKTGAVGTPTPATDASAAEAPAPTVDSAELARLAERLAEFEGRLPEVVQSAVDRSGARIEAQARILLDLQGHIEAVGRAQRAASELEDARREVVDSSLAELRSSLDSVSEAVRHLTETAPALSAAVESLKAAVPPLEQAIGGNRERLDALEKQLAEDEASSQSDAKQLGELKTQTERAHARFGPMESRIEALERNLDAARAHADELRDHLVAAVRGQRRSEERFAELTTKHNELLEQHSELHAWAVENNRSIRGLISHVIAAGPAADISQEVAAIGATPPVLESTPMAPAEPEPETPPATAGADDDLRGQLRHSLRKATANWKPPQSES